jgi:hypothetical protein
MRLPVFEQSAQSVMTLPHIPAGRSRMALADRRIIRLTVASLLTRLP